MPLIYTDEPPTPDEARRILAKLPDGLYPLKDLAAQDLHLYTAAAALISEETSKATTRRTVTFQGESGESQLSRPAPNRPLSISNPAIRVELGQVSIEGNRRR